VLVNNAGAMFPRQQTSADGFEMTFALNQLGYYTLTLRLIHRLRRADGARVINVASDAHRNVRRFSEEAFTQKTPYSGWRAYCHSKLANVLFSRELARRLARTGITSNALHPGFVASNFLDYPGIGWKVVRLISRPFALSIESGAATTLHLVSGPSDASRTGQYFAKCQPVPPSALAQSDENARRLWALCEEMTKVTL
jgi:NAD(P)-dependent dehydrogenase (short-subunit alcohol dehydrogenase family)